MGLPLITLAEYKAYEGITNPNQDTEITSIIPKVSELVKNYCKILLIFCFLEKKQYCQNIQDLDRSIKEFLAQHKINDEELKVFCA